MKPRKRIGETIAQRYRRYLASASFRLPQRHRQPTNCFRDKAPQDDTADRAAADGAVTHAEEVNAEIAEFLGEKASKADEGGRLATEFDRSICPMEIFRSFWRIVTR